MKKTFLIACISLFTYLANAQITAVDVEEGSNEVTVEDIIIVFKMHFDIGYTDWAEGVLQKYSGVMLRETLKGIDATYSLPKAEQFIWTVPSWPLKYMIENCPDELRLSLDKALREGRITPHGLPCTYETDASDLETLVRGLSYSDNIRQNAGRELSRDAKLTDVPSHSHILPTLLKNAGIDFLHIGCNPGSTSPDIPVLSFWEGKDGKRILLMNWAEYYGSGVLPPKNWPHKTWLAMIHTHENTGAPTPREVAAILKEAKLKMPKARIRIGEMKDFYDCLMEEEPNLPVIKGDMPDTWIHGYASNPRATKLARNMHRATYDTESLINLLNIWGVPQDNHQSHFDKAIENQILYDEHTFGIAMTHADQQNWKYNDEFLLNKSLGYYDYAETSWREKQNRIEMAERIVKPILRNGLRSLASNVAQKGKRVVVYNPSAWMRSDRVTMFLGVYQKKFKIYGLKNCATGEIIPVHNDDNLLSFDAKDIPAMGYITYQAITEPQEIISPTIFLDSINNIIENNYFKVEIDAHSGTISSAIDKKTGRELVDKNSSYRFGEIVHERFGQRNLNRYIDNYMKKGADWAIPEFGRFSVPEKDATEARGQVIKLKYDQMPNGVRISVFGSTHEAEPFKYITSYSLYAEEAYIEINCGINGKIPDPNPESTWMAFPFAIQKPDYHVMRLGGIVDPVRDFTDKTNMYYYFIHSSIALTDKQGGVALDTPDAPGISIDSTGLFKFSKQFIPKTGLIFSNLYNNQWGTNFTEWIEGSFNVTYRVRSFEGFDPSQYLVNPSEQSRSPLYAAFADGAGGNLAITNHGVNINKPGVVLTTFTSHKDGMLLRLWEKSGEAKEIEITLPSELSYNKAFKCNLRGIKTNDKPILIEQNRIKLKIEANAPVTLLMN